MLVTFEDSQSALRVMDIDGVKVRPPQIVISYKISQKWLPRMR